jgi:hypothetical protein
MKFLLVILALALAGCTTVLIDSEVAANGDGGKTYMLIAGEGLEHDPYRQKEVLSRVDSELQKQGYRPAEYRDKLSMIVRADFFDRPVKSYQGITSRPIYGQTSAGGYSQYDGTIQNPRNSQSLNVSGNIYTPPQYGVVGVGAESYTESFKPYVLVLDAIDGSEFYRTKKIAPLWRISGTTVDVWDRRKATETILKAMGPRIGKSFAGNVTVPK